MTYPSRPFRSWALCLGVLLLSTAAYAVDGPRVVVVPPSGKPPDLFAAEGDFCRSEAENQTSVEPAASTVVGSAAVGAVMGAAVGSVFSSRRVDRTGAGAVTGLILGTATGLNRSAMVEEQDQRHYDAVYEQCMVAKGNVSTRINYRVAPAQAVPAPPPPPAAYAAPPLPPVRATSPPPPPAPPKLPASGSR